MLQSQVIGYLIGFSRLSHSLPSVYYRILLSQSMHIDTIIPLIIELLVRHVIRCNHDTIGLHVNRFS